MTDTLIKPLSEAIFDPVNRAYKAGGYGLVFVSLGALLMLTAYFTQTGMLQWIMLGFGLILISLTCILFYFKDIKPLSVTRKSINHNKQLIDTVQRLALEMTELASTLQAIAFKYADQVGSFIKVMRPQLQTLPVIGQLVDNELLVKTDTISSDIVEYTQKAKSIIRDVEKALETSNPENLKKYIDQIKELTSQVDDILKK